MDPFSITIGALTLAQTGTNLTTLLFDLGKDIKSASTAMAEVASDVQLTSTLLTDLAHNLEANPTGYSENFLASAKNLCDQCKAAFDEIELMIGGRERGVERREWLKRVKWAMGGKSGVGQKQERLRKLQFMFLFVSQIEMLGGGSSKQPNANGGAELTAGNLEGQLVEVPVQIGSSSSAGGKEPARYMATLTLRAAPPISARRHEFERSEKQKDPIASKKCLLVNMRRSPRFSADLIQPVPRMERLDRMQKKEERLNIIEPYSFEQYSAESRIKPAFDEEREKSEPRIPSQKEAEDDIDSLLASWSKPPSKTKASPSSRPRDPPSPRPSAAKLVKPEKSPTNPPDRTPSVRIHEAPGLPPIKSYGPTDYPSSSRRPAAPSPPLAAQSGGQPRSSAVDPRGSGTLRTTAQVAGGRSTRRPRSEEIPRDRVTRYYVDRRKGEVRDRDDRAW